MILFGNLYRLVSGIQRAGSIYKYITSEYMHTLCDPYPLSPWQRINSGLVLCAIAMWSNDTAMDAKEGRGMSLTCELCTMRWLRSWVAVACCVLFTVAVVYELWRGNPLERCGFRDWFTCGIWRIERKRSSCVGRPVYWFPRLDWWSSVVDRSVGKALCPSIEDSALTSEPYFNLTASKCKRVYSK